MKQDERYWCSCARTTCTSTHGYYVSPHNNINEEHVWHSSHMLIASFGVGFFSQKFNHFKLDENSNKPLKALGSQESQSYIKVRF